MRKKWIHFKTIVDKDYLATTEQLNHLEPKMNSIILMTSVKLISNKRSNGK